MKHKRKLISNYYLHCRDEDFASDEDDEGDQAYEEE